MAAVTVRLHGAFREMAGAKDVTLDAGTVGEVLDVLPRKLPGLHERIRDEQGHIRDHLNVFHNEDKISAGEGEATPVQDGDVVYLVPAMSGGDY